MKSSFQEQLRIVKKHSLQLTLSSLKFRNNILLTIAEGLQKNKSAILKANQKDQKITQKLVNEKKISPALFYRMQLDEDKFEELLKYSLTVAKLADPLKKLQYNCLLDERLSLKRYSVPLGVLLVIFESRPEVLIQISSLAIKSSNGVLLKGGSEAKYTNRAFFEVIEKTLQQYDLQGLIYLLETREDVKELLQEKEIDLIIPRGSNKLVQYIQKNTKTPVMGHTDGICHIFVDQAADKQKTIDIVIDGKCQYPAACNATETLLLHTKLEDNFVVELLEKIQEKNIQLRLSNKLSKLAKKNTIEHQLATRQDWNTEYTDTILAVKEVKSVKEAIEHINHYGSQHTDSIVTENKKTAEKFLWQVDSAGVFHNVSTRFADGNIYGLGAEVGISTNKLHARGPVGLEGLMSYKYILQGEGQIIANYKGPKAKKFLHKIIP